MLSILNKIVFQVTTNVFVKVVLIAIILDTILGIGRAIKQKKFNSSVGIDGAIRKVTMILCLIFLMLIDNVVKLNLIGFIPEQIRTYINVQIIGLTEFFAILYIMYEAVSVLKNMALCGLPMPKKFRETILKFLNEMTDETKAKEV